MEFDYPTHLQLDCLLTLQHPKSFPNQNDEEFFIIVHQIYELLFKALIREIEKIKCLFNENNEISSILLLKRSCLIMRTAITQFDYLTTMTPDNFNEFRSYLGNASGLQSYQFRAIEFLLGYKRPNLIEAYKANQKGYELLLRTLEAPSLIDAFYNLIEKKGATIPKEIRERPIQLGNTEHKDVQASIVRLYKEVYTFKLLVESMMDFDEIFLEWRQRHLNVVERIIGKKIGTGKSNAEDSIRQNAYRKFFPDLWEIRSQL